MVLLERIVLLTPRQRCTGGARVSSRWGASINIGLLVDPALPSSAIDYLPSLVEPTIPDWAPLVKNVGVDFVLCPFTVPYGGLDG